MLSRKKERKETYNEFIHGFQLSSNVPTVGEFSFCFALFCLAKFGKRLTLPKRYSRVFKYETSYRKDLEHCRQEVLGWCTKVIVV